MSSSDFYIQKKPNYFSDFIAKGYIFPAILIAALVTTLLGLSVRFDFINELSQNQNTKIFAIITIMFYLLLCFFNIALSIKNEQLGINDAISFSFIFIGIFFAIFILAYDISLFTMKNIVICSALFISGLVISLVRTIHYNFEDKEIAKEKNISSYFAHVNEKFSFGACVIISIVINSFFFMIFSIKLDFGETIALEGYSNGSMLYFDLFKSITTNNYVLLGICAFGVIALLLYAISSLKEREICSFDLFLAGFFINSPLMFALIFLLGKDTSIQSLNFYIAAGAFILLFILLLIRKNKYCNPAIIKEKNGFFSNLFKASEFFKAIGISAIISYIITVFDKARILSIFNLGGKEVIYVGLLPALVVIVACIFGLISFSFNIIKSILSLKDNNFIAQDRSIISSIAFSLFEIAMLVFVYDKLDVVKLIIFFSYFLIAMGTMFARDISAKR